jgi:type VI secretion system protein VasJ
MMNIVDKIAEPISKQQPVGEKLSDNALVNFIDDEMMKVSSLAHGSIAWEKVEAAAIELLTTQTKDIKILTSLMQCLQQNNSVDAIQNSLAVFEMFMRVYWESAYPVPGDKGKAVRNRFYKQIMQRSSKALKRIEINERDTDSIASISLSLKKLEATIHNTQLEQTLFDALVLSFKDAQQPSIVDGEEDAVTQDTVNSSVQAPNVPQVYFDPKNERAAKQALFTMADFLNIANPSSPIGYRVRRNALWLSIWQLPETKQDNVTELAAFSADRYAQYASDVEKKPSIELLKTVERSIEKSPYWFDGHYLSYQLCKKLGYQNVAQSIVQELDDFIGRIPDVLTLKAQNKTPFVNATTLSWIQSSAQNGQGKQSENNAQYSWHDEFNSVLEQANTQGLNSALAHIDSKLKQAVSVREQHYWRLINADLLNQQQFKALAQSQYQVLLQSSGDMQVEQWEPAFSKHIHQSLQNIDN